MPAIVSREAQPRLYLCTVVELVARSLSRSAYGNPLEDREKTDYVADGLRVGVSFKGGSGQRRAYIDFRFDTAKPFCG